MSEHCLADLSDQKSDIDAFSHIAVASTVSSPLASISEASFKQSNHPEVHETVFLSKGARRDVRMPRRLSTVDSLRPPGEGLFDFPIVEVVVDAQPYVNMPATPSSTHTHSVLSDRQTDRHTDRPEYVEEFKLDPEPISARYAEGPFRQPERRAVPSSALSEWGTASTGASPRIYQRHHDEDQEMTESDAHYDTFTDAASNLDVGLDLDDIGYLRFLAESSEVPQKVREAVVSEAADLCTY
jgi:hypothetical protein